MDLEVREAVDDVDARLLERARPLDVAPLVEARLQLDEADALLALLGASISAGRAALSPLVRYTVVFIAITSGSAAAARTNASKLEANDSYGWWTRTSPRADLGEQVARPSRAEARAGRTGARARTSARAGRAARAGEVGEVERPGDRVDLVVRDAEPCCEPLEHRARHRARDLEPHDVAEAAPAQLQLDRLEQVVGLVRDLEVGVARDAEAARSTISIPGKSRRGSARSRSRAAEAGRAAEREEARQALGHLDAREALLAALRVATSTPRLSDSPEM